MTERKATISVNNIDEVKRIENILHRTFSEGNDLYKIGVAGVWSKYQLFMQQYELNMIIEELMK
jgi:hypothetical protein